MPRKEGCVNVEAAKPRYREDGCGQDLAVRRDDDQVRLQRPKRLDDVRAPNTLGLDHLESQTGGSTRDGRRRFSLASARWARRSGHDQGDGDLAPDERF